MKKRSCILILCLGIIGLSIAPWAKVPSSQILLYGLETSPTYLGKPGLLTIIFTLITAIILFAFHQRRWGRNAALLSAGMLISWQLRNWILLSICNFGECLEISILFHILTLTILLLFSLLLFYREK